MKSDELSAVLLWMGIGMVVTAIAGGGLYALGIAAVFFFLSAMFKKKGDW